MQRESPTRRPPIRGGKRRPGRKIGGLRNNYLAYSSPKWHPEYVVQIEHVRPCGDAIMTALRVRSRCLVLALLALAAAAGTAHAQQGKRYAFLVGVQKYQDPKLTALEYCQNDVQDLGQVLGKIGYEVVLLSDSTGAQDPSHAPTRANIEKYLKAVLEKTRKDDVVLLAFAGHGMQLEGKRECYFCPQDARLADADPSTSLVSLNLVYDQLDRSFAR